MTERAHEVPAGRLGQWEARARALLEGSSDQDAALAGLVARDATA